MSKYSAQRNEISAKLIENGVRNASFERSRAFYNMFDALFGRKASQTLSDG